VLIRIRQLRTEPQDNNLEEAGMPLHNLYLNQILDRVLRSNGIWQQLQARRPLLPMMVQHGSSMHQLPLEQSGLLVLCLTCAQKKLLRRVTHILDAAIASHMRKENLCGLAMNHLDVKRCLMTS
jgi:hypothetical protein